MGCKFGGQAKIARLLGSGQDSEATWEVLPGRLRGIGMRLIARCVHVVCKFGPGEKGDGLRTSDTASVRT